jgi:diketogulonate reductase-like aldo/keto reductase
MQSEDNRLHRLETWKGLIELRNAGKVRNIGVSNFMVKHLQHLEESSGERPCLNQFEVHPLLWQ